MTLEDALRIGGFGDPSNYEGDWIPMTEPMLLKFARAIEAETIAKCAKQVPTNWTDSLLTGKDGIKGPPYDCREIEKLLRGTQDRIRALSSPPADQGQKPALSPNPSAVAEAKCDCHKQGPAKNMEKPCEAFDRSPSDRVSWCRTCGHQKACPFHHLTRCKTCDGSKRLWQQYDPGCGSWIDCPDCAPKDRAESQAKCVCVYTASPVCGPFGLFGQSGFCLNCDRCRACHGPAPADKRKDKRDFDEANADAWG